MIDWNSIDQTTVQRAYYSMAEIIKPDNYGTGDKQWTLTELVQTEDARRYHAYKILDGVDAKCVRHYGMEPLRNADGTAFLFRFKVTTRQACCRTADGQRIFQSRQAFEDAGDEGVLPEHTDAPQAGDVVEWKGLFRTYDTEKGRKVDGKVLKEWAMRGIRPEIFVEFIVDKDGCISVPYPYALSMLVKRGKSLAYPRFSKRNRGKKGGRRLTNWWFEEVPKNYRAPKPKILKDS